jgi:hypothetical protein
MKNRPERAPVLGADGLPLVAGKGAWYIPAKGPIKSCLIEKTSQHRAKIVIGDDPFPVIVSISQVSGGQPTRDIVKSAQLNDSERIKEHMPKTIDKPKAKELQKMARSLGIKGYESMGLKELRSAVEEAQSDKPAKTAPAPARKASTGPRKTAPARKVPAAKKTAPAKKTPAREAAKKERPRTPGGTGATKDSVRVTYPKVGVTKATEKINPFRKNANLFHVAPLLFRGGNRQTLATKLSEKVELHPYQKETEAIDLLDFDKRLLLAAQTMRDKFGFGVIRTGRGIEGTIKVFVVGSSDDPGSKNGRVPSKKAAKATKG